MVILIITITFTIYNKHLCLISNHIFGKISIFGEFRLTETTGIGRVGFPPWACQMTGSLLCYIYVKIHHTILYSSKAWMQINLVWIPYNFFNLHFYYLETRLRTQLSTRRRYTHNLICQKRPSLTNNATARCTFRHQLKSDGLCQTRPDLADYRPEHCKHRKLQPLPRRLRLFTRKVSYCRDF